MVLYSIVIVNVWGAIGGGMIIFLAGLQAIPKEYYEVARIDGATVWQRLRFVTIPALAPSIFFQTVLTTINAFQAFDYIYILTRIGQRQFVDADAGVFDLSQRVPVLSDGRCVRAGGGADGDHPCDDAGLFPDAETLGG